MQIIRSPRIYDVCIVGSGAGGGTTAKVLTESGADVVMLEGGPMWDSAKDSAMFAWNYDSPTRGFGGDKKPFDAVRAFKLGKLGVLAMGPFIAWLPEDGKPAALDVLTAAR